jgi:aminomethyltransferase
MTVASDTHADHGATFVERDGREVVDHYGRPERTHRAVRNGVGVIETSYGVVVVQGSDRHSFVDDTVSNRVPREDGEGTYALLLTPQGRVDTDMYVYNAGERLLVFTPPGRAASLASEWGSRTFVQDVRVTDSAESFGVFGVHGPSATEKIASVLDDASPPEAPLSFVRGGVDGVGVTVIATDAPPGEEGYEVVCAAEAGRDVLDSLLTRGLNAVPFGYRTWDTLTLEAGTPRLDAELADRAPNVTGVRNGYDLSKGCFVGQEVVSKVANRGQPSGRVIGFRAEAVPERDDVVFGGDDRSAGAVTRAAESPTLEYPIGLAIVDYDLDATALTIETGDGDVAATRIDLPFVEGSARSARVPRYDD